MIIKNNKKKVNTQTPDKKNKNRIKVVLFIFVCYTLQTIY